MKFSSVSVISLLGLAVPGALAVPTNFVRSITVSASYDQSYDIASSSLTQVACSDGVNGLINKGFSTFGSLPSFPFIGGAPAVAGWNSPSCGSCWELQYQNNTINVLAIDAGSQGFNLALEALNKLTNNQAIDLGRVTVTATQVNGSACGLSA